MSDKVKLPVIDTLGEALSFAAKRFPTVIKVALLPSLILMGPIIYIMATSLSGLIEVLPQLTEMDANEEMSEEAVMGLIGAVAPFYLAMLLLFPLQLLHSAMVAVPISRAIVLDEKPGFFRLDGVVWRYFFGQIVMFFLIAAIAIAVFAAAALGIAALETAEMPKIASVAVGLTALTLFLFIVIRLSLFMVEVAVSGKFAVRAAFSVTRRNVWRLVGAGLLFVVLILAIEIVFEIVLYIFGAFAVMSHLEELQAAAEADDIALVFATLKAMIFSPLGGAFAAVFSVFVLFMTGLQSAFPAALYKNLGGGQERP